MATSTTKTNKPINPRGNDQSPKGYNRAALYSGKALDFDGVNDNLTATGSNALSFSQITMSAYFKFDNLGATQVIFAKRKDVAGYWSAAFIMSSSGELDFRTTTGTTEQKVVYSDFVTGEYYHAVGVKDDSNNYLYINGQLVDTTASGAIDNTTTYDFVLGNNATGQYYYNGQISNAKVFDVALTAAQVADLYNNPEKVVPTGVDNTALKLWLPMMEGAGTTAYDGSGNGNHGTISGATYVNGVGAPVAQSAVIDWNKGENYVANSLEIINANFTDNQVSSVPGFEAPDGTLTASKITSLGASSYLAFNSVANNHKRAIYAKTVSGTGQMHLLTHNSNTNNLFDITNEWQKFTVDSVTSSTGETSFYLVDFRGSSTLSEILIWAPNSSTTNYNIVPTLSTAQPTPVLLPQGLTSGRDITGVNLFENVRKQGALNLDGNSWAEVHDNASLDITTAITLEAWVYLDSAPIDNVDSMSSIMTKKSANVTDSEAAFDVRATGSNGSIAITGGFDTGALQTINIATGLSIDQWYHIGITYDSGSVVTYLNGAQVNTGSMLSPIIANAYDVWIGRHVNAGGLNSYAPADIAQPRIYNRALTAEEVERNYNAGKNIYK